MDDTQNPGSPRDVHDALDALGDLFLTPGVGSGEGNGDGRSPLEGPPPIRLMPKLTPTAVARARRDDRAVDGEDGDGETTFGEPWDPVTFDTYAGAGLASSDAAEGSPSHDQTKGEGRKRSYGCLVEAVLLANLPGLAGAWLTQYAQLLAQRRGPVVLVHVVDVDEGEGEGEAVIEVELVLPRGAGPVNGRQGATMRGGGDAAAALRALVQGGPGQSPAGAVLVHVDATDAERAAAVLRAIPRWTLVCGGDAAASASAGAVLEWMLEAGAADREDDEREGVDGGPTISLMVMGGDDVSATAAAERVRASVDELGLSVELAGHQQRMMPASVRQVGSFAADEELWATIARWQAVEVRTAGPRHHDATAPPTPVIHTADAAEPRRTLGSPSPASTPAAPATAAPTGDASPDLLRLAQAGRPPRLRGAIALEARAPASPATQLVLDAAGVLHLLHHHTPVSTDAADLEATILRLVQVRQWAVEHRALLQLTHRQARFDAAASPVMHVFTPRGDLAGPMIGRLGPGLKVHLLQEVEVGGQSAWFCSPLS